MGTTADGGKGSKERVANGDWPVGAASRRREQYTMASCQPPLHCALKIIAVRILHVLVPRHAIDGEAGMGGQHSGYSQWY